MAESLMTNFAASALKKVLALAANEIILYFGFKKHLATLQKSMEYVRAVVRDAEQKQLTTDTVVIWMKNLKDVADRAELVLDEIEYEILRRKVGAKSSSSSNSIVFRYRMARKIKKINDSIAWINKQAADYNLQQQLNVPIPQNRNEETDSLLDEFRVVGRDEDAAALIRSLTGSMAKEKLTIIPIVGMGGIGKTTLAQLIYNDLQIKGHFDVRIWVCVGVQVDDVTTILLQILEFLTRRKEEVQTRETILQSLKENLGGKKYLLVLDDVWNEELRHWENFRSCMLKANNGYGNSIIVTTRSKKLATNATQSGMVHTLHQLSDDYCWSIIRERAFPDGGPIEDLMGIGMEIARRCCGVPLAAKVAGGMLCFKKGVKEWEFVRDCLVRGTSQEDQVLKILKLSFHNLPNPLLKHCFSYCSIFRKDTDMEKAQLIELWMALGFLEVVEGARYKDMEDVGHDFFNSLVQNSLFQDVRKDDYGNINSCKMHDLVHDLALSISGSQCLSSEGSMSNDTIPKDVALYDIYEETMFEVLKHKKAIYLRSLFLEKSRSIITEHISLNHFKCLRILNLRDSWLKMLPDSIGELIHLRYLDLSYNRQLEVLPKSIGKLYLLQTLRLTCCSDRLKLPNEVSNFISLRHLHIDDRCNIAPFNIGRFTYLQTLECFLLGKEKGRCVEVLGSLKNLRGKLQLCHLEEVNNKREALSADLIGKLRLTNLLYSWGCNSNPNHKEVLEGLQAPPNLKVLVIQGYWGENFPEWVMKMAVIGMDQRLLPLDNLVDIRFYGCERCERVPMLGQLPHLQKLEMWNMKNVRCIDESFYGYSSSSSSFDKLPMVIFPALKRLEIRSMKSLETWMDVNIVTRKDRIGGGEGSSGSGGGWLVFPSLEKLYLEECPMIKSLPYEALRGALLSLKCLEIRRCDMIGNLALKSLKYAWSGDRGIGNLGLNSLKYAWSGDRGDHRDVLEGLQAPPNIGDVLEGLQAPPSIEDLTIGGYWGDKFPEWVMKMAVVGMDQKLLPLHNLVYITFFKCERCERVPMLGHLPNLQNLHMTDMENVRCIDESFYGYCGGSSNSGKPPAVIFPALRKLEVSFMPKLETWMDVNATRIDRIGGGEGSSGLSVFPHLEELYIFRCPMINSLPYRALRGEHLSLKRLTIYQCYNLGTIPSLQGFTSLEELIITSCEGLTCLPELSFHHYLRKVEIFGTFKKLNCMLQGDLSGITNTLEELEIGPLSSEPLLMKLYLKSIIGTPTSSPSTSSSLQQQQSSHILRKLTLHGQPHWDSIPEEVQHLTALAYLKIRNFGSLEALPDWFAHLSSLEKLDLYNCSQLQSLPSTEAMGRLTKLKTIEIRNCPPLKERVAPGSGPEWSKVSHIPHLYSYLY